jgi:hypothetical protein
MKPVTLGTLPFTSSLARLLRQDGFARPGAIRVSLGKVGRGSTLAAGCGARACSLGCQAGSRLRAGSEAGLRVGFWIGEVVKRGLHVV